MRCDILIPSCILDNPVSEVPDPSEFEYNYWLVSHWYLHSEEIKEASFYEGNTTKLYNSLSDPYTQYIPPLSQMKRSNKLIQVSLQEISA